jgi:hypothetical protein
VTVKIERIEYKGWHNVHRISNPHVELWLVADIGPRILRYSFLQQPNMFAELQESLGGSGEATWQARGGHRLWVAPETEATYALDNNPVHVQLDVDGVTACQETDSRTGLEKRIQIVLGERGSHAEIRHRIVNRGSHPREVGAWALTMMAPGGVAMTGFPPRGPFPRFLLPTNPLVMWAYTDFTDPRWTFTTKYLVLRQDPNAATPQKVGLFNPDSWGAYLLNSTLFLKQHQAARPGLYPDFGASFEMFTDARMLELETLGPATVLQPDEAVDHLEHWSLYPNVSISAWTDAGMSPLIDTLRVENAGADVSVVPPRP